MKATWSLSIFLGLALGLQGGTTYSIVTIGPPYSDVADINDSGLVLTQFGEGFAVGMAGQFSSFSFPGNPYIVVASGLNDAGDVVGGYALDTNYTYQGFLVHNGTVTTINAPGAQVTFLSSINNAGNIVGFTNISQGILLSNGVFQSIQVPGSFETYPERISNTGEIAGWYVVSNGPFATEGNAYAYTEMNGVITTLTFPSYFGQTGGPSVAEALGVNDYGDVVGFYDALAGARGFIYSNNTYTEFNIPGAIATFPDEINDSGQISGYYYEPDFEQVGFVATPVPEPATTVLLAVLLLLIVVRKLNTAGASRRPGRVRTCTWTVQSRHNLSWGVGPLVRDLHALRCYAGTAPVVTKQSARERP